MPEVTLNTVADLVQQRQLAELRRQQIAARELVQRVDDRRAEDIDGQRRQVRRADEIARERLRLQDLEEQRRVEAERLDDFLRVIDEREVLDRNLPRGSIVDITA